MPQFQNLATSRNSEMTFNLLFFQCVTLPQLSSRNLSEQIPTPGAA